MPRPQRALALTFAAAAAVLALAPGPAAAADGAVFAGTWGGYWHGFVEFWVGSLKKQNGIVMFALGLGAVSIFIITRGKWKK